MCDHAKEVIRGYLRAKMQKHPNSHSIHHATDWFSISFDLLISDLASELCLADFKEAMNQMLEDNELALAVTFEDGEVSKLSPPQAWILYHSDPNALLVTWVTEREQRVKRIVQNN